MSLAGLCNEDHGLAELLTSHEVAEQVEIEVKYAGYIARQLAEIERFKKMEARRLPAGLDYEAIKSLSREAREKLSRIRPTSLGQASRISGIRAADLSALMIHLAKLSASNRD